MNASAAGRPAGDVGDDSVGSWSSPRDGSEPGNGFYRLPENRLLRYGSAILLVGVAFALSLLFRTQLSTEPSIPFFGVVVATAFLAGFGPALVATVLSVLAVEYLFFEPFALNDVRDLIELVAFGSVALLISWLADRTERSREELIEQRRVAEETTRRALLLSEAGRFMTLAPRYEDGLQDVAELLVREIADYVVAYAVDDDHLERVAVAHADPGQRELVQRLLTLRRPGLQDEAGVGATIRDGEPILTREIHPSMLEETANGRQAHLQLLRELDPVSAITVPFRARGRIIGALSLVTSAHSGRRYDEQDLKFARDLGDRVAIALDNARLLAEARTATRTRERAMAVVAHDLRNPLNVIIGAAELLSNPTADVSPATTGRMLKRASEEAGDLIRDLLDVSRMEAGEFKVSPESVSVTELLRNAETSGELLAESEHAELEVECASSVDVVLADPARIRRVFSNLLDNAFEHSPKGGRVLLSARSEGEEVLFSVTDEGPGIPEESLPHVFDQFWQGEKEDRGAGLGLPIVQGIVKAHGGRVWVESREGEGTSVFFTLPTANTS